MSSIPAKTLAPPAGLGVHRDEDFALTAGAGTFVDDLNPPDCLHLAFHRAMIAHGRVTALELEDANAVEGVRRIFSHADLTHLDGLAVNPLLDHLNVAWPGYLAGDFVHAVGQPIVAAVADTRQAALDACEVVFANIDDLDPVPDVATAKTATPIFEVIPGNLALAQAWFGGDVTSAFARADRVVEVSIDHPRLAPSPMEPRTVLADWDGGMLTVWIATQTPHRTRAELVRILRLEPEQVRVIAPDVGGGFGMKAALYPEDVIAAYAAITLQAAVKWTATRSEDFISATHGRGLSTRGALAVSAAGDFLALRAEVDCPLGYWLPFSACVPAMNAGRCLPGPYAIPAADITARGYLTTTASVGIYRGAGRPEAALLMERLANEAARALGLDPVEIRRRNLVRPDAMPFGGATGTRLDSGDYPRVLDSALAQAGYRELREEIEVRRAAGELVGSGIGFYVEPSGTGYETASAALRADGTVLVSTGSTAQGQGRDTASRQIAAGVLGVPLEMVTAQNGDTVNLPDGIGALASRSTAIGGSALLLAARALKALILDGAEGALDSVARLKERALALPADDEGTVLRAEERYEAHGEAWGCGCYVATVSIDRDTGAVTVERIAGTDDAGVIVNPMMVEGQVVGGIAQGIGETLLERLRYDGDAQFVTGSFMDYCMPRADDMPRIDLGTIETPATVNAIGAKGIGEAGTIGAPPAIHNAILDALAPLGITTLPFALDSEIIWRAISAASNGENA